MKTPREIFFFTSAVLIPLLIGLFFWVDWAWIPAVVVGPFYLLGWWDVIQKKHALLRIYPVLGHLRFLFESIRPEIQQYFVESNINGRPVSREFRDLVYQRAKGDPDTRPFGTQFEVYRGGYQWVNHSLNPAPRLDEEPRVIFGSETCSHPYAASHLNISAMSFGSLSRNPILALNTGARRDGFAHNTGEGGVSPYHLQPGGDLIWQIGTGYFGCRTSDGKFDPDRFAATARQDSIKMIEIKLSQGAKPGHGGILPAAKLTPEIAAIRGVPLGRDVLSPPSHSAFTTPVGLLQFVAELRRLSGGKPVGFKLCLGHRAEFFAICKAMLETGLYPDFITVDGGEGGTGAAPIEFTNSVGTPLRDGLSFVRNALRGIDYRSRIRLIASGKIISAFDIFRAKALGADTVNSARAMMFALGCIQARRCNSGNCPTGIATQDPARSQALDVDHKAGRVARYHRAMIRQFLDLVATAGLPSPDQIRPCHVNHRVHGATVNTYEDMYPEVERGCLLRDASVPPAWARDWDRSSPDHWAAA
ncbi:MAG: FMN-binding glutamate synthase family protein [Candidatus Neomarinimicrobiota bacterium]|nr:MAG: FMN-binding glutamate synthase family protein [Candidatus Neomarinimicrobiota bacterium]